MLSKKESSIFANENRANRKLGAFRSYPKSDQISVVVSDQPEVDELLENTLFSNNSAVSVQLTKREMEILRLIISGKTNKQIARKLCRSERTVEYHRNRLMHKLRVKTAAGLVKRAITMGLA